MASSNEEKNENFEQPRDWSHEMVTNILISLEHDQMCDYVMFI